MEGSTGERSSSIAFASILDSRSRLQTNLACAKAARSRADVLATTNMVALISSVSPSEDYFRLGQIAGEDTLAF